MARPTLGDSDTQRLHIKITEAEIEAIDDWRFANRVPSRSEAVRRLCKIGIDFHHVATINAERAGDLIDVIRSFMKESDGEERVFYTELFNLLIDVGVFGGRALRYGGKEDLSKLLSNDAALRRGAEEEEEQ